MCGIDLAQSIGNDRPETHTTSSLTWCRSINPDGIRLVGGKQIYRTDDARVDLGAFEVFPGLVISGLRLLSIIEVG